MKLIKLIALLFIGSLIVTNVAAQANAYVNILTQNSGLVNLGATVFIEVTVGNTGPVSPIGANKVRAQLSVPAAIAGIPLTGHILPAGWTITVNTGSAITVCNGSDIIAAGTARTILINVQGNAIGGPSTVNANLLFSSGISCTTPGSLPGDNTADNSSTSSIQVIAGCPLGVTASTGTIACNGGTTTLTATATGTSGAVEYSITGGAPFQPGNSFTVAAGTYAVTAREIANPNCVVTGAQVTVTEPAAVPEPSVSVIQPTCTNATGVINITSATTGLTFSLDGNTYAAYPAAGYIVAPGAHTIAARNSGNCVSVTHNVTIDPQPATPATATVGTVTQPTCAVSTGSVVLTGLPAGNWTINPGAILGTGNSRILAGLAPATYNFTITNDAGCTSLPTTSIVIDPIAGVPDAPTISVLHPTCTVGTGTISVTSTTAGLHFSFDGAPYTTYPVGGYVATAGVHSIAAQNAGSCISPVVNVTINAQPGIPEAPLVNVSNPTCTVATGLITVTSTTTGLNFSLDGAAYTAYPVAGYTVQPGNHTLSVQNSGTCISPVTDITVNAQPASPTATVSAGTVSCFGGTTTLTVAAAGGTGPYEFSINAGPFQPENTFTVTAGSYTVTVKDQYPCSTATAAITIAQPNAIIAAAATSGSIACNGGTTTLTVNASGGTPPYQYSLNGGAYQQASSFSVGAGIQTVTLKDANACTQIATAITVTQPAVFTVSAIAPWITTCGGTTLATITASGGTAPYTGTGAYVKGPGTWNFTVTDAAGCTAATNLLVEAPGCVDLEIFPNPASNNIYVNHSIAEPGATMQVFETNGSLVLSKAIQADAFLTTLDVRRFAAGTYVLVYINGKARKSLKFEKITK
ncbi:hypothetical protein BH11BAC4_BH11BAC4_04600 [soil metagenome]